jgi:hypothetical protein
MAGGARIDTCPPRIESGTHGGAEHSLSWDTWRAIERWMTNEDWKKR